MTVLAQATAVMGMTHVTGKATGGAPPAYPTDLSCDEDDDNSPDREWLQMWSLYGVENDVLGKAMANLATDLPRHGWKVISNGPDSSKARSQEIVAVHRATDTRLRATWHENLETRDPVLLFDVYSGCFHASAGT